jgi:hypothetical protein
MLRPDRSVSSCPDNGSAFRATEFRRAVEAGGRSTGGSGPGRQDSTAASSGCSWRSSRTAGGPPSPARRGPGSRLEQVPQRISRPFQLRPRPHRAPHQRKTARRHSFRRPQDEDRGMSDERRYISGRGRTHLSHIGGRISAPRLRSPTTSPDLEIAQASWLGVVLPPLGRMVLPRERPRRPGLGLRSIPYRPDFIAARVLTRPMRKREGGTR